MNKSIIIKTSIFILLIIIISSFFLFKNKESNHETNVNNTSAENVSIITPRKIAKNESLTNEEKINKLLKFEEDYSIEYLNCLAIVNNDPNICQNSYDTKECLKLFYWDSFFLLETDSCENLEGEMGKTCLAYKNKDIDMCNELSVEYNGICLALIKSTNINCNNESTIYDECIIKNKLKETIKSENIKECSNFKSDSIDLEHLCRALITKNPKECDVLINNIILEE